MLVISPPQPVDKETTWVNTLLSAGLKLFHIRKYNFTTEEMKRYLDRIDGRFANRLVLHSHDHLAEEFGINRLHVNEHRRCEGVHKAYRNKYHLSTSTHDIETFNALSSVWDYAFLSPVFESISKPEYGKTNAVFPQLKQRSNTTVKLVGLGGITPQNGQLVKACGADDVAMLGSIWQAKNPLQIYIQCRDQLY